MARLTESAHRLAHGGTVEKVRHHFTCRTHVTLVSLPRVDEKVVQPALMHGVDRIHSPLSWLQHLHGGICGEGFANDLASARVFVR